jgi:hypothetical protein
MAILEAKAQLYALIVALQGSSLPRIRVDIEAADENLLVAAEESRLVRRELMTHGDSEWDRVLLLIDGQSTQWTGRVIDITSPHRPRVPRCAKCGEPGKACAP